MDKTLSENVETSKSITGYYFSRLYNARNSEIKKELRRFHITHPQFSVFCALNSLTQEKGYANQSEIAKDAEMDVMTVGNILKTLESNGYIERKPDPTDSRASAVFLLEKGHQKLNEAFPVVRQIDDKYFNRLGEQRALFDKLLAQILFPDSTDNKENV